MSSKKVYSRVDTIPKGLASGPLTEGCIVLEGGAFRGVYTSGVLDKLMQEGINMSCVVGVSAGALIGMNYVSGQIGRAAEVNLTYRHKSAYVGLLALLRNRSVIGYKFVFDHYPETQFDDERFNASKQRFVAVATNCLTGKAEYFEKSDSVDMYKVVKASSSMPYLAAMVKINKVPYLDGGCSCKIPYEWAIKQGYEKIVVVKTRDKTWRRNSDHGSRAATLRYNGRYRELGKSLATANERTDREMDEMDRLEKEGRLFVIAPSTPVEVTRLEKDMEKLGNLYWQGYNDTEKILPDLKKYLRIDV